MKRSEIIFYRIEKAEVDLELKHIVTYNSRQNIPLYGNRENSLKQNRDNVLRQFIDSNKRKWGSIKFLQMSLMYNFF